MSLPVEPDPVTQPYDNPAHALVLFDKEKSARAQRRLCAQELAHRANTRGVQYSAEIE